MIECVFVMASVGWTVPLVRCGPRWRCLQALCGSLHTACSPSPPALWPRLAPVSGSPAPPGPRDSPVALRGGSTASELGVRRPSPLPMEREASAEPEVPLEAGLYSEPDDTVRYDVPMSRAGSYSRSASEPP